jgi:ABC-2 type transport system permease protein
MLRRLKPIMRKEFLQISRDSRSLGVLLVLPAFLVVLIGYALNFDVKHVPVAVFDQDHSGTSREFVRSFETSEYFVVTQNVSSYRELDLLLGEEKAHMALVIPPDFSDNLLAGRDAPMQIIIDGANANTATTVLGYASVIVQNYSANLAAKAFERIGREMYQPIELRPKIWYNPELSTAKFLIPGMIGFILMITGVVSTSLSVVREKERGTMEQLLLSPLRTGEVILGKTIPYLAVALVSSALILVVSVVVFGVSIQGSIVWLFVGIILFLFCALGQGILISAVAQTQQVAFIVSVFSSLLPTFLLSGFIFPISSMPLPLRILSNIAPAKYFLIIARSVILKGTGPEAYWQQFAALGTFATVALALAAFKMMKRPS